MSLFRLAKNQEELEEQVKSSIEFAKKGCELYRLSPMEFKSADYEGNTITYTHKVEEHEKNLFGIMHGGIITQLLDTAIGFAAYELGTGNACSTMDLTVNFIKPVNIGDEVDIKAEVVNCGKHTAVLRADMTRDGEVMAFASGTYRIYTSTTPEKLAVEN